LGAVRKKGLDYFSFDVKFFSDKKIKILKSRYGINGIILYIYLLCEIYDNGYYLKIDNDYEYIISDELNLESNLVKQVMNFLLERSLFDNKLFQSDKVLTSAGIQKRFQLAVKTRAKKNPIIIDRFWLLESEETEPFIKVMHYYDNSENNDDNSRNNSDNSENKGIKESKVKESKVKESKVKKESVIYYPSDEKLNAAFASYVEARKQMKSPMTSHAVDLAIKKLDDMTSDNDIKIEILEQSIINGWKGIFPLNNANKAKLTTQEYADSLERWANE